MQTVQAVLALALLAPVLLARAHVPYFEPEAFWVRDPALLPSELDWSLESPFVIDLEAPKVSPLLGSRAIWSVIGGNDTYDLLQITIDSNTTQPAIVLALAALVPACEEYVDFYPSIALLGPASNPQFSTEGLEALPFDAPEGYGAIIYNQEEGERDVYVDSLIPGYGAYFPIGINTSCLVARSCQGGSISGVQLFQPGTYYIAVWDPAQQLPDAVPYTFKHDIITNLGVTDDATEWEEVVEEYVIEYGLGPYMPTVHAPRCTQLFSLQSTGEDI